MDHWNKIPQPTDCRQIAAIDSQNSGCDWRHRKAMIKNDSRTKKFLKWELFWLDLVVMHTPVSKWEDAGASINAKTHTLSKCETNFCSVRQSEKKTKPEDSGSDSKQTFMKDLAQNCKSNRNTYIYTWSNSLIFVSNVQKRFQPYNF